MRFLFILIASLVIATLAEMIAFSLAPGPIEMEWRGDHVHLVGNIAFIVALALLVAWAWRGRALSVGAMLAVPAFLILVGALVYLGTDLFDRSPALAAFLTSPVGTIGSYPGGADMPFEGGITQWAVTALVPIGLGLLIGAGARQLRRT